MAIADCSYTLIDDIGKDVILRKVTEGAYNVATGSVTNTTSDETVKAMILNYRDSQFDGSLILQGDRKIVIAAKDATIPQADDLIIEGSNTYRLISVRTVEENDVDVIFTCQGRKE